MIEPHITGNEQAFNNSNDVCPLIQLLIALYYYVNGSFQLVIGDSIGIHKSTTSRIIHPVYEAKCSHFDDIYKYGN